MWKKLLIACLVFAPVVAAEHTGGQVYIIRRGAVRWDIQPVQTTGVSLIAQSPIERNKPFQVYVVFNVPKNTFVYWDGDPVGPPIDWEMPEGFGLRRLDQQPAESFTINDKPVYGYTNDRTVAYEITPPDDLESGEGLIIEAEIDVATCDRFSCRHRRYEPKAIVTVK